MISVDERVVADGRLGTVVHIFNGSMCELVTVRFDDGRYGSYLRDQVERVVEAMGQPGEVDRKPEEKLYYWLLYRPYIKAEARATFYSRFGRDPEEMVWDPTEDCWWLGMVTARELAVWRKKASQGPAPVQFSFATEWAANAAVKG